MKSSNTISFKIAVVLKLIENKNVLFGGCFYSLRNNVGLYFSY